MARTKRKSKRKSKKKIVKDLNEYVDMANGLLEREDENINMMMAMDDYEGMDWDVPAAIAAAGDWLHVSVVPDLHIAVQDGVKLYSTLEPKLSVFPMGRNFLDLDKANMIERALFSVGKRAITRKKNLFSELIKNAILYDKVCIQVKYLPHEEKINGGKLFDGNDRRRKNVLRKGKFSIILHNPKDVFVQRDSWGTKGVLHRQIMDIDEINSTFPGKDLNKSVNKFFGHKKRDGMKYATVWDYVDYDRRVVWLVPQNDDAAYSGTSGNEDDIAGSTMELLNVENELDFLPWSIEEGGEVLSPLLHHIYLGGKWDTMNIFETFITSEVISYMAAPRIKRMGFDPDSVEVNYGEAGNTLDVPEGHTAEPIDPPKIDRASMEIADRLKAELNKAAIPATLQNVDFRSGTAFSTVQEIIKVGIKSLIPFKELSERATEGIYYQILYWMKEYNDPLLALVLNPKPQSAKQLADGGMEGLPEPGQQTALLPGQVAPPDQEIDGLFEELNVPMDFDPDDLIMEVKLEADMMVDKLQQLNAANMFQQAGGSKFTAYEEVGIPDPKLEMERRRGEDLVDVHHANELKEISAQADLRIQRMAFMEQMAQQEQVQAMQAAQQNAQNPPASGRNVPDINRAMNDPDLQNHFARQRGAQSGSGVATGEGFNPAAGGTPPVRAARGAQNSGGG